MSLTPLQLLAGRLAPGVWAAELASSDRTVLVEGGADVLELDLGDGLDKDELLARLAAVFGFPSYFGHNWDAAFDSLADRPGGSGEVWVVFVRSTAGAADLEPQRMLVDVFNDAAAALKQRGICLYVLWPAAGGQPALEGWPDRGQP